MVSRRGKRSTASELGTKKFAQPAVSSALGMTPAQFSSVVLISIVSSHCLDAYRSTLRGTESLFCNRYFSYASPMDENSNLLCTESDIAILTIKYQTTAMRMALYFLVMLICWSKEPLLKTWNYANAISPLGTSILGLFLQKDTLAGPEIYSLGAVLLLTLISNFLDREDRKPLIVKEGFYNIILFLLTSLMSYWISNHLILGVENYLVFNEDDITEGGRGLWNMMVGVEYTSFMFVSTFALFYLDELRKRTLLFGMGILMLVHTFYQLPKQKDFWQDASGRQSLSMILFFAFIAGALIPSFDKAVIKK